MQRILIVFSASFLLLGLGLTAAGGFPPGAHAQSSGLPLPRFASLRASEVNMRAGPGIQYPIDWIFQKRHLPVEIISEFETWRRVRDHQGTKGWVHQSMLSGARTVIVLGRVRTLRAEADSGSSAVAKLEPDVVLRIVKCGQGADWCRVRAAGYKGFLRRAEIWGVGDSEEVRN